MAIAQVLALSSSTSSFVRTDRPKVRRAAPSSVAAAAAGATVGEPARRLVAAFDPAIPLASAVTPPSEWYTDPEFLRLELDRVFLRGWQAVGHIGQVKNPNDFFTGRLGNVEFVICQDAHGKLHAFHNVCRHHASLLACGSGQKTCFQCPYHGWTYGLDGALLKATRISGIKNFNKNDDQDFIDQSLKDSEQVQIEDIALCEGVQKGLESPAYGVGRYAPSVEMAMHHFHRLLHTNLSG